MNLNELRLDAKISEDEIAKHLNITIEQVTIFENNPDNVSQKLVREWVSYCHFMSSGLVEIFDTTPRAEIQDFIKRFLNAARKDIQTHNTSLCSNLSSDIESFIQSMLILAKKPRVGVFGRFDAGKSSLCNVLLGSNRLPTAYTPATSIICLIRHISDKPTWQDESVSLFKKGFDLNQVDNQNHCKNYKIAEGDFDLLNQYGVHNECSEKTAFAAVMYVDASILNVCDLLDLPGYGHSEDDEELVEAGHRLIDIFFYLSQAVGFMEQSDQTYLNTLIANLPIYKTTENELQPLRNIMLIATRADKVGGDIELIFDKASKRIFNSLENTLKIRAENSGLPIGQNNVRERLFSFNAEHPKIREKFEYDLKELLCEVIPKTTFDRMNLHLFDAINTANGAYKEWITQLSLAMNQREVIDIEDLTQESKNVLSSAEDHFIEHKKMLNQLQYLLKKQEDRMHLQKKEFLNQQILFQDVLKMQDVKFETPLKKIEELQSTLIKETYNLKQEMASYNKFKSSVEDKFLSSAESVNKNSIEYSKKLKTLDATQQENYNSLHQQIDLHKNEISLGFIKNSEEIEASFKILKKNFEALQQQIIVKQRSYDKSKQRIHVMIAIIAVSSLIAQLYPFLVR